MKTMGLHLKPYQEVAQDLANGRRERVRAEHPKYGLSLVIQSSWLTRKPTNTFHTWPKTTSQAWPHCARSLQSHGCCVALTQLGVLGRGVCLLEVQKLGLARLCRNLLCELLKVN